MIKNNSFYEDLPSIKKDLSMDRVARARKKQITNLVDYIKTHVDKLTEKFIKSEENLKKFHEEREKLFKLRSESRDQKLNKILITRRSKSKAPRYYDPFTQTISKQMLKRSTSLPRIKPDSLESTEQELEKINQRLESSYSRAQDYKKSVSLSASRRMRKANSASLIQSENEYRKKLEVYIMRQQSVAESKKEFNEKVVDRLKKQNSSKAKAYNKSVKERNKELKVTAKVSEERIMAETIKVENAKKSKELQRFMTAEKWRQKKNHQVERFKLNKEVEFKNKEKIIEKAQRHCSTPSGTVSHINEDLYKLKNWRDAEIYKSRCKLFQFG